MIGSTISHYKVLEKLGEGGMGVVYKAQDTKLDRLVALKFLPEELSKSTSDSARFLQEAKAAAALNHPSICTIHGIEESDGHQFIVMEFVDGQTLGEKSKSQIPNLKTAIDIAIQIADGLAAAHEKGITHRDIKPDNIMIRKDGIAQIMDFGLAKLRGVSNLTQRGSTVGTTAYMSPEQVQGEEADHRTDIFALGVVMYELLSGQLPFKGAHEAAVMYEIINVDPQSLRAAKPKIEPDLEHIVMKCLDKDRENRYQSVREVAVDLKRFKRDSQGKGSRASSAAQTPQSTRTKRSWIRFAVPVAVAAIGVFAWFLLQKKGEVLDSLAVLPFENTGNDPNMEYLSDGITESIINSLTKVPDLRVIPRSTAFRLKGIDPQEAGTKLQVHAVLSGRVFRQGDDLNVQVDLIDVEKKSQLWGQQYRRSSRELLSLQEEITNEVSTRLRLVLTGEVKEKVARSYTDNPEAYKLYLQGRYSWNNRRASELQKAIGYFNQALALDPSYALAYVGLADSYALLEQYAGMPGKEVYPKAVAAASRALEIDNSLAEAHTTLAFANLASWNWEKSEQGFKFSISLNPNYPTTYHWYAILLHTLGRHNEALTAIKRAQELDPLSSIIGINVAIAYYMKGEYARALQHIDAVLLSDSSFSPAYSRKSQFYVKMGRVREGYAASLRGVQASGRSAEALSFLGYCAGLLGRKDEALTMAKELEQRFASGTCPGYYIARVYAGLGDDKNIFKWLNVDFENHSGAMIWLPRDPEWDRYRSDPRFVEILKNIGLEK
ncbi:MAG: protein kinase [Bacteroidota bacterium]